MRLALLVVLLGAALAATAAAPLPAQTSPTDECLDYRPETRIDEADGAFVGRVLDEKRIATGYLYRFAVVESLKARDIIGTQIDVSSPDRLLNPEGEALIGYPDLDVGVMFSTVGTTPSMTRCDLVPPLDLVSAIDEPRGNGIKVVIGIVMLLAVLLYSTVRLKRKQLREQQGASQPGEQRPE